MKNLILALMAVLVLGTAEASTKPPCSIDEQKQSCVLASAATQVGVTELTGNNDGKEVEAYLHVANLKKGNPYCAAFIMWNFQQCGIKTMGTAYSPTWFPSPRVILQKQIGWSTVLPGDVFGLYFKTHNRIAHVGLIEKVMPTYIITLEANTSPGKSTGEADRNGDGVWRKHRMKKGVYAVSRWLC